MDLSELNRGIEERTARVAVLGLGYVGLPVASRAADVGFEVVGIDPDEERLASIAAKAGDDPGLSELLGSGRLTLSSGPGGIGDADIVIVCVPTPLRDGKPDLSFVMAAASDIASRLQPGSLVSLESTTFPGTTEEVFRLRLEEGGLIAGSDFALAYSPERISPGEEQHGLESVPKIVSGIDPVSRDLAASFYSHLVSDIVVAARPREAELAKLIENTYRRVNIALANEFAMIAHELDIDIWHSIDIAATKPFGFQAFYPGVGAGGHCIAVDPIYLTHRIRELGRGPFRLVELASEIDDAMPNYIVGRISGLLSELGIKPQAASLFVLGVTYKRDVADLRNSRALEIVERLGALGSTVGYHDPFHPSIEIAGTEMPRTELRAGISGADLVVILTDHSDYDWEELIDGATHVFDARGTTRHLKVDRITRL